MSTVGGYFELELSYRKEYYPDLLKLNTGRNCLEYLLRAGKYTRLYLPFYSCKALVEPLEKLDLDFEYYPINRDLEPVFDHPVGETEALLYINYFGIKNRAVIELSKKIRNLIVDNSQAFYARPLPDVNTFYSPRKFFGVPDGAYLSTSMDVGGELEEDRSSDRFEHLLRRAEEEEPESAYDVFVRNEEKLSGQPILKMSKLTRNLLSQIDYEKVKDIRNENFHFLHQHLAAYNQLNISLEDVDGPMVYPFWPDRKGVREFLVDNNIYVASYWPNVQWWTRGSSLEYELSESLLPLPIDQRYNSHELSTIVELLTSILKNLER